MFTFVIVGFKVDKARSVHYGKAKNYDQLMKHLVLAFDAKGAEFVSLRRVPIEREENED